MPDALDKFLFDTHRGFCEQYAAAFAELARSIGLPTRVAVGYQRGTLERRRACGTSTSGTRTPGPRSGSGRTVGWYRFEPTPGRIDPVTGLGGAYRARRRPVPTTTTPPTTAAPATPTTAAPTPSSVPNPSNRAAADRRRRGRRTRATTRSPSSSSRSSRSSRLRPVLRCSRSRSARGGARGRRRHDPDDRRRVLGAWTEALERLAAAGIERRPSTTSLEFALRQAPALGAGAAGPPLMSLARLHTAAMYAPDPPSADEADEAWTEVDAIAAALRSTRAPHAGAGARAGGRSCAGRAPSRRDVDGRSRHGDDASDAAQPRAVSRSTNASRSRLKRAHVGVDLGRDLIDRDEQARAGRRAARRGSDRRRGTPTRGGRR